MQPHVSGTRYSYNLTFLSWKNGLEGIIRIRNKSLRIPVFRTCDILARMLIRRSGPLTKWSRSGSGSCSVFVSDLQDANKKYFFSSFPFEDTFTVQHSSNIKSHKKQQNSRNKGFSYFFCLMMEGSGSGRSKRLTGHTDPDPERCRMPIISLFVLNLNRVPPRCSILGSWAGSSTRQTRGSWWPSPRTGCSSSSTCPRWARSSSHSGTWYAYMHFLCC